MERHGVCVAVEVGVIRESKVIYGVDYLGWMVDLDG